MFSVLFIVGANCVRPRAFTERPYEIDFAVGKTCFMEGTPSGAFSCWLMYYKIDIFGSFAYEFELLRNR